MEENVLYNRELSWLSFNYRVLQEAKDEQVPLLERLRFLAIYSSNLDEFYRVRVASVRSLINLTKKTRKKLNVPPAELLKRINSLVDDQQQEFGEIFQQQIIPKLAEKKVFIVQENDLSDSQLKFVRSYFKRFILPNVEPHWLHEEDIASLLQNHLTYLAVRLKVDDSVNYAMLKIPTDEVSRFVVLPSAKGEHKVILIDDIMRLHIQDFFDEGKVDCAYSIKLSRDAELYLGDEFSGDLVKKIKDSLNKRDTGVPARFLFDEDMPDDFLGDLQQAFQLSEADLMPGARYHNFSDYMGFPSPGVAELEYEKLEPISKKALDKSKSLFDAIKQKDHILHYPYHKYDYVVRFIEEAAQDEAVDSIKITLYRVASDSRIAKALILAAQNGKEVEVFDEVKARFDEQANIYWGEALIKAGAKVRYSYPDLKVHSKICLIKRREGDISKRYAYIATGNFNEKTARIYADHGLFTADETITKEINGVFKFLLRFKLNPKFKSLLVAPFQMREGFVKLIDKEISNAKAGKEARITAKMNSLEDEGMVEKLYEASKAGVKIKLIVRGICCLVPGIKGMSENIEVISIVDRYLEHARVYIFHNGGREKMILASADWMSRNLDRRVETAFPIKDRNIRKEIKQIIELQLKDNTKARRINELQDNPYVERGEVKLVRSQMDTYKLLAKKRTRKVSRPRKLAQQT